MSDLDSEASLPLPASPEDDDIGRRRKLSVESDSGIDKIPEPQQPGPTLPLLEEIPYPSDVDKDDIDQDIPLPPDSSKYSPSQAIVAEDDTEMNIIMSPAQSSEATSANISETSKPKMHVLGKEQAKKRLAAFSAAKMASAAAATSKKTTAVKGITVFHQSSKSKSSQENLAIASIKQEEEKMKEVMALNSILSEKLKQVSVISTSIPKPPPVTAVIIPTVISADSITLRTDTPTADIAIENKADDSGAFTKKSSSFVIARNIRSKRESSSSRSRSRSHSKSESPVDSRKVRDRRSRSRDRRSRSKDRRSRSRERKRSKERKSRSRSEDKYSRNRDKRSRSKDRRSRSRDRNKRSRSRDRRSRSRDRGRARRRSRSRDRRSRSKEKTRGKRDKGEHKSSRKSKSRSPSPVKKKDRRRSRSKSPTKSKKKDKKRSSRSRSRSREMRERKKERDQREKERKEKETIEREKREKERKEAQRKRELEEEFERELDKVRRSRMPNDWQDFIKFQYKYEHIQRLWIQMAKVDTKRTRSGSRSSDESDSRSTSRSKEILQPTPLSLALQQPLKAMSTVPVELQNGSVGEYPADFVKKTTVQPCLTYGSNRLSCGGYYKTREQAFKAETSDNVRAMNEVLNVKSTDHGPAELQKYQQWFASNEMLFCPSDGSKGVLISHLYTDDMEDSPSESSRPLLDTTTKKPVISSVRSDTKSKSSEETDHEQDSMDSAPSPLLKKKYEHEDKGPRVGDERVRNGDKDKRERDSSRSSLEESDVDEYNSRSKQGVDKIEEKVCKRVSKREDVSPIERISITKDKPAKGKQDSDDEYLEEMDVDFQLEKEKPPQSTNVKESQNEVSLGKEKPKEDLKDKKRKEKEKKDKKQKKKKRHHKVSKKKSRDSSADGNSSSDEDQAKPKNADVEKHPAPKSDVSSEVKSVEAKQKHDSKKKREDRHRKCSGDSNKHSSDEESDDSARRQPKRKRSKLATTKEDEDNSKEKTEEPKTSTSKRSERSRSRSPDRKHKKSKDKKTKKKKSESKPRHKKKHSKKSRTHSTSSASSNSDKPSSSRSSSSSSSSGDSDTDSKRKHKKKKDSEGDKSDKKKDDKNKRDKGGGGASSRRGGDGNGGGTSHSRDNDHKDRSRKDRDSHDHRRDKDRRRRHSGGRKRISYEELMQELINNPLGPNGDINSSEDEQDPEKIVASLLSTIDVPNIQNHVDTFATTALISELDDDEILKSVLENEDINISEILLKTTSNSGADDVLGSKSSTKKRISSSWSDLLSSSSGYGTEKSTGLDVNNGSGSSGSSSSSSTSGSSSSSSTSGSSSSSSTSGSSSTSSDSSSDSEKQTSEPPQLLESVPSKLYDPFRTSSESDADVENEITTKSIPTIPEAMPIPTLLSTGFSSYSAGSSRSRSRSRSPRRRRHRSDSYERNRNRDSKGRRSPSPRGRVRDRHWRSRSRSRSSSRSRCRHRRDDSFRRHSKSERGNKFEHEFESSPAGFSSPHEDYRRRRRREFEEILQKEGFGIGLSEIKTDSPPLQLNVADSTISDSELAATGVCGLLAAAGDIFGGISKEALFEHNQHMHANSQSMYFYPPHPAQPEGGTEQNPSHADTLEYPSSPKRLSLDERLEKEMGIHLHEEPSKISLQAGEISKGKLPTPWNAAQKQSQVTQVGNMIQVCPAELAKSVTITGSQECEAPQETRRVVTIKVPVVPFKVPVLPITDIVMQPQPRSNAKPKRKKKTVTMKLMVVDATGTDPQHEKADKENTITLEAEQEKTISKEITASSTECVPKDESEIANSTEIVEEKPVVLPNPKTPQHLLYPARGILVSAGFRERTGRTRGVTFRDGINPGDGTSSSGGEEMGSPTPSQGVKVKIKRSKSKGAPKIKTEGNKDDSNEGPPPAPSVPYPYCPPGILYQVNLPYAVVYAQAVAEKGFDIVFQPSDQIPTIGDEPCEAVLPDPTEGLQIPTIIGGAVLTNVNNK